MTQPTPAERQAQMEWARTYRLAALADGWTSEPLSKHEAEDQWSKLKRDGFVMQIVARSPHPRTDHLSEMRFHSGSVSVWGPDGLAIRSGESYSWPWIQSGVSRCLECGAENVKTFRSGWAGRACETCLPAAKKRDEYPGWTN